MSLGHDLMTAAGGRARGDMSAAFGVDHARRLVHRADSLRLPVNPLELKAARAILRAAAAPIQPKTHPRHR